MPTYVYRREDGSTFEVEQRITEDPLKVCPDTGQKVERVITGAGLIFKGSGFYLTDYARKNGSASASSDSGESKESKDTSTTTTKSADSSEKSGSSNGAAASSSKTSE